MYIFCTLFDLRFLPQGLTLYESLKKNCKNFHLYIFAFDDKCFTILNTLNLENVTVISLNEFEDNELLGVKEGRTKGEYCWTCTSSTILYLFKKYNVEMCTYIDADLYFYSNPEILLKEIGNKSVIITEHRFSPEYDISETYGKYCVQFITFKNNEKGLSILKWWRNACIEWCFAREEEGKYGDQKYLDDWTEKFEDVHVLEHPGGGLAPWNIQQYAVFSENNKLFIRKKDDSKKYEVVFYHFHTTKFNENIELFIYHKYYKILKNVKILIYKPYLQNLKKVMRILNKNSIIESKYEFFSRLKYRKIKRRLKKLFKIIFRLK